MELDLKTIVFIVVFGALFSLPLVGIVIKKRIGKHNRYSEGMKKWIN